MLSAWSDRKQAWVQGPRSVPGVHAGMQVAGGKRDCESQRSAKRARLGESGVTRTEQEVRTPASAEPLERWCRQQSVHAPVTNHLHVLPAQHQPVSQPTNPWPATPEQCSLAVEAFLKGCAVSCMSWLDVLSMQQEPEQHTHARRCAASAELGSGLSFLIAHDQLPLQGSFSCLEATLGGMLALALRARLCTQLHADPAVLLALLWLLEAWNRRAVQPCFAY